MVSKLFTSHIREEIDDNTRFSIVKLHESGHSYRDITRLTGIPKSTAGDIITRWSTRGSVSNMPRAGRPPKLSHRDQIAMTLFCQKNRAASPEEVQAYFRDHCGVDVSLPTLGVHSKIWAGRDKKVILIPSSLPTTKPLAFNGAVTI